MKQLINKINTAISPLNLGHIYEFFSSNPGSFKSLASKVSCEVSYQREVYFQDSKWFDDGIEWLDLELPVGQEKGTSKTENKAFIDLIGKRGDEYVLCELKYNEDSDNPIDAMLQVLEYYVMIIQNCSKMNTVFHSNNRFRKPLIWSKIANNLIIQLRAPADYWDKYEKELELLDEKYIVNLETIGIKLEVVVDYPICK